MLTFIRRTIQSSDMFAILFLVIALVLIGIPLKVSLFGSFILVIAIFWQCSVGLSIWARALKPTNLKIIDILGPGLATGVASTTLGWLAVCRFPWMTAQIFSMFTIPFALDGLRIIRLKLNNSDDKHFAVFATTIAIVGLGYHRAGLLALGLGLFVIICFTVMIQKTRRLSLATSSGLRTFVTSTALLAIVIFAVFIQVRLSNRNQTGFVPDSDTNFGEAIALGITSNSSSLSPFTPDFRYHWLTHGWLGVVIRTFHLNPFVGPSVLVPFIAVVASVFIVFSAVSRWRSANLATAAITSLLLVAGASSTDQLVFGSDNSTSNQIGTLFLLLSGYFVFSFLNDSLNNRVVLFGSLLIGLLLMGAKGPLAIVLVFALASHLAMSILHRNKSRRSFEVLSCVIVGAFISYLLIVASTQANNGITIVSEISNFSSVISFFLLIITLCLTRIPLLIAPIPSPTDRANRFLAIGAAVVGIFSYFAKTENVVILYFLSGAITLALFFSCLSMELTLKSSRRTGQILFFIGFVSSFLFFALNFTKIYHEMIPKSRLAEFISPLAIQNFQLAVILTAVLYTLLRQLARFKKGKIWPIFLTLTAASTFGVFVSQSLADHIRQLSIDKHGMNGGPDDSSLLAKSIIESASWIRTNSQIDEIVGTNYLRENGGEVMNLVSVSTQRSVLYESQYSRVSPTFIKNSEPKRKTTLAFSETPSEESANALTAQGVVWYLFKTADSKVNQNDLCRSNPYWSCEFQNEFSAVIRFNSEKT